jgi:hypothetical protein
VRRRNAVANARNRQQRLWFPLGFRLFAAAGFWSRESHANCNLRTRAPRAQAYRYRSPGRTFAAKRSKSALGALLTYNSHTFARIALIAAFRQDG